MTDSPAGVPEPRLCECGQPHYALVHSYTRRADFSGWHPYRPAAFPVSPAAPSEPTPEQINLVFNGQRCPDDPPCDDCREYAEQARAASPPLAGDIGKLIDAYGLATRQRELAEAAGVHPDALENNRQREAQARTALDAAIDALRRENEALRQGMQFIWDALDNDDEAEAFRMADRMRAPTPERPADDPR